MQDKDLSNKRDPIHDMIYTTYVCKNCDEEVIEVCGSCSKRNTDYYVRLNAKNERETNTFAVVTASIFTFILIPLGMYLKWIPGTTGLVILYLSIIIYGGYIVVKDPDHDYGFLTYVWITLWFIAVLGSIIPSIVWILDNTG